jgi:hypothetical protein
MFDDRLRETWISLLLAFATVAPAGADGPKAGFKLNPEATVFTSPDQKVRVEQYSKDIKDGGLMYQFWTFAVVGANAKTGSRLSNALFVSKEGVSILTGDDQAPW